MSSAMSRSLCSRCRLPSLPRQRLPSLIYSPATKSVSQLCRPPRISAGPAAKRAASIARWNSTSTSASAPDSPSKPTASATPPRIYTFDEIQKLASDPDPTRVLIDVRSPSELSQTGHIPTARNLPLTTHPDALFLAPEEFEDRFGFAKPTANEGDDDAQEIIFYCRSGVRSAAAANLAGMAGYKRIGEYRGSWLDWVGKGGKVEGGGGG